MCYINSHVYASVVLTAGLKPMFYYDIECGKFLKRTSSRYQKKTISHILASIMRLSTELAKT